MPGIENWLTCPLSVIQRLFVDDPKTHDARLKEYFLPKIQSSQASGQVPSLNDAPTHNLATNSIVQFRAMVQDMHDPEFYLGVYEVENIKTGQKYLKSGKYRDIADCGSHEEIKLESPRNVTMDRQSLYCVPVPGECDWVKKAYAKLSGSDQQVTPSTSVIPERTKRSLDDQQMSTEAPSGDQVQNSMETDGSAVNNHNEAGESKKARTDDTDAKSTKDAFDLNFPIPGERGPGCLVKLYDTDDSIKLNDIIELVGVLSNDPAMASFPDEKQNEKSSAFLNADADMMEGLEEECPAPPPSLVPRLHVISLRKLTHNNPLLPQALDTPHTQVDSILSEAGTLRSHLISVLTKLLMGDHLAAEYLLCHLVSSVYTRHDVVALGKFALNISGCPRSGQLPKLLHGVVKELVAKCHLLAMSLDNMNKMAYIPKKDYKANRLQSGILQLADKTHLVLDETALQPGQLDTNGVTNMTAIGNVISWQKVDYDFNFHQQEFTTNIVALVLSEGKSILKCDCHIPLVASRGGFPDDLEGHFQKVLSEHMSSLDMMNKLRAYIGLVQLISYDLPAELQKEVEQDFVDSRKESTSNMSVEDFHSLLVLARLLSLTHGEKTLTQSTWERAKLLELDRKTRLVITSTDQSLAS